MGWTVAVAGVRDDSETAAEALRAVRSLERRGRREGWSFAAGRRLELWRCEQVASKLARRTGQPAFAAWVDDSDCAYIGTADADGGHTTWLPIAEAVSSYEIEDEHSDPAIAEIRRHNQRWLSLHNREQAALELANWSEHSAPASTTATAIVNTWRDDPDYPGDGPVFIEDTVREILELVGLPRLDIIANVICAAPNE